MALCKHCGNRTCSFARFIAIDVLARDPHRDRQKVVEQLSSLSTSSFASIVAIDVLDRIRDRRTRPYSRSTYSFAIIIAIDVLVRDHHRDRRMLSCNSRRSRIARLRALSQSNVLVRVCDRRPRSRSSSRSKNCRDRAHSIMFAIDVLARDPHRDRTSSVVLSRQDNEVVGCVASRRASDRPRRSS